MQQVLERLLPQAASIPQLTWRGSLRGKGKMALPSPKPPLSNQKGLSLLGSLLGVCPLWPVLSSLEVKSLTVPTTAREPGTRAGLCPRRKGQSSWGALTPLCRQALWPISCRLPGPSQSTLHLLTAEGLLTLMATFSRAAITLGKFFWKACKERSMGAATAQL